VGNAAPNPHVSALNIPVPAGVVQLSPSTVTVMVECLPFCAQELAANKIVHTTSMLIFFITRSSYGLRNFSAFGASEGTLRLESTD
jgi:YbbR domain-containing protein